MPNCPKYKIFLCKLLKLENDRAWYHCNDCDELVYVEIIAEPHKKGDNEKQTKTDL
jgi:hypothetical protein